MWLRRTNDKRQKTKDKRRKTSQRLSLDFRHKKMKKYLLITTATNSEKEANKLARILLEDRLISCCQISKIKNLERTLGKKIGCIDRTKK